MRKQFSGNLRAPGNITMTTQPTLSYCYYTQCLVITMSQHRMSSLQMMLSCDWRVSSFGEWWKLGLLCGCYCGTCHWRVIWNGQLICCSTEQFSLNCFNLQMTLSCDWSICSFGNKMSVKVMMCNGSCWRLVWKICLIRSVYQFVNSFCMFNLYEKRTLTLPWN